MRKEDAAWFDNQLQGIRDSGLWKNERILESPQGSHIRVKGREVINFCANNYLGLANDARLCDAAVAGLRSFGLGLASVRFICGTQSLHKDLEQTISSFLRTEDTILYTSCFDANGGLFETILTEEDAIVSDELNHASIIDGIRLCKAKRFRYVHMDMADLEKHLKEARFQGAKKVLIATDGVFSMDGHIAPLQEICSLAERYEAMLMVDDSHATGFFGPTGRGSIEHCGVMDRVDVITSTLGKALGGSSGGFTSGSKRIIDLLRNRSRPYLFSNSVPPAIAAATLACLRLIENDTTLRDNLARNTIRFRQGMTEAGFAIAEGEHPICPVMLGDAKLAAQMADALLDEGIYVIGFSYPVVPHGKARIRVQLSAAHSEKDIDLALAAFTKIGRKLGIV